MKGLSITTLGEQSMIMQYDSCIKTDSGNKFIGLRTYYNQDDEPIKGTREEVTAIAIKIGKKEGLEITLK